MRALTIADGRLLWREHPDPVAGERELLVKVRAAGLNAADLLQLRGLYPAPPGYPQDIPGLELAGQVLSVGGQVRSFAAGDRVMALVGGGAQAELALIDEESAIPVPDEMTWPAAGGFPEAFLTAHDALFSQAGLALGDRVLITGAAGGVGTAAVQLAARAGAHVVASARSAEFWPRLTELGAAEVASPDGAFSAGPFDVILELVGGPNISRDLDSLASGGRVMVIGTGAGASAELNLGRLMQRRGRLLGSTLRSRALSEKALVASLARSQLVPLLAQGVLSVPVMAEYPMAEAEAAYERHRAGGKFGKIVLTSEAEPSRE